MRESPALILPDGRELALAGDLTIGRDEENDLPLDEPTVSRRHAIVSVRNGRWFVTDCGSFNGTYLNGDRIAPGVAMPLRHADRIAVGGAVLLFSVPHQASQHDTEPLDQSSVLGGELSPFQRQVVECLCGPWLEGRSLDELPTNEEIAAKLGTPHASDAVKAALRRAYAKAGLTSGTPHAKRRLLCRVARQRGWI